MTRIKAHISPKMPDNKRFGAEVGDGCRTRHDTQRLAGEHPEDHAAKNLWNVGRTIHSLIDHYILMNNSQQIPPCFARH